jgi:asparagine synthetase B (glutamine-hydrolysing)
VILDVSADGKTAKMYVARDPMGVRPLFYAQNNSQFCVSSEMKGLCDEFDTVNVFPPGHYAEIDFSSQQAQLNVNLNLDVVVYTTTATLVTSLVTLVTSLVTLVTSLVTLVTSLVTLYPV